MPPGRGRPVTGVMAAGKSTVAQAPAEALPRAAHVRGDVFRRMIVSGREEYVPGAGDEAEANSGSGTACSWTVGMLDEALRTRTPRIGPWLETSELTVEQTVEAILAERERARVV
ncbi:hypothetical protein [Streptomyces coeruleofuscus]|uniref:Uncharacterized protein n=1 Tax=Streptomyces coeruleofuscus TaxID=66879 RepID=A0ABP5W8N4_9ACTN